MRIPRRQPGATLIEILTYMGLVSMVMLAIYGIFVAGQRYFEVARASVEVQQALNTIGARLTRDLMETLRTAKANGAKIILITHYEDSPGAKLADIVLLCGAQESPLDSGSIPIKVAVLYVAEVLVLRYILDDKPGSTEAQERTTEALAVKLL